LEEAILQVDPAKPSDVAEERSTRKALRGDLDWIVLKAMANERDRRYASAADLGADLRRFLRNEPVDASPPSATYRIGKFVRRHRVAVTAATLLVLSLLAGTVGTTAGMFRARRADELAAPLPRPPSATRSFWSTCSRPRRRRSQGRDITAGDCQQGAARIPHRSRERATARSAAARHHRLGHTRLGTTGSTLHWMTRSRWRAT
jgi:hypothetical protein